MRHYPHFHSTKTSEQPSQVSLETILHPPQVDGANTDSNNTANANGGHGRKSQVQMNASDDEFWNYLGKFIGDREVAWGKDLNGPKWAP